jgi:pimeloyl-ACP methyl ester carboxylesterase
MILVLIALLIADIISIAYPFIAFYLFREWNRYRGTYNDDYADRCLWGAIALLALILLGRFLIKMLLSKRRKGADEPELFKGGRAEQLQRPDGSSINIEFYGNPNGQPILFVHGLNANIRNWYYQLKYFEKDYRLVMMDLPGMGRSTRPVNKDFSMEKLAGDINAVIAHTGIRNPILWGHSMGGMAILTLLAKCRAQLQTPVKGIILQHTTYTNPVKTMIFSKVMTVLQKPVLEPICRLLVVLSPIVWVFRWLTYLNGNAHIMTRLLTFAGTQTPKQLEFTTLLSTMTPPAVMARGCLGMFRYDVSRELKDIKEPALIIAANRDRLTRPFASTHMKAAMPNARLAMMQPGNHQALIERHAEVNASAEGFIRSLG